ncbi:MAG TPA: PIN domain-containing protein [Puia sp.]|nr:PIN domain-containing protein [Puia sp.]
MAFRLFLDTDVLLDFTLKRDAYGAARQLMEWAIKGRIQLFITPCIVQIANYCLAEAYGPTTAKELLSALLADVQVIDIGHEITVNALHSQIDNMEQALQYYTALHHKLDYFITRDKSLDKTASPVLPVCRPEEFIKNNL